MTEKQGRRNQKKILADLEAKPVSLNYNWVQLLLVPSDFGQIRVKTCSIKWPLIIACPPQIFKPSYGSAGPSLPHHSLIQLSLGSKRLTQKLARNNF